MSALVQTSISSAFFEELPKESILPPELLEQLSQEVESRESWRALQKAVRDAKEFLDPDLHGVLRSELEEIQRDLVWLSSKRGQYVTAIESWQEPFR